MSEELKRKLHNYEADPPALAWNRIASALDEEIQAEFPQRLYALEQTPPLELWSRIEKELEKDSIEQYPSKLYNAEVTPPQEAWNKISTLLDEEKTLPKISPKGRTILFVRYAVAACIIGIVAFGVMRLVNQTEKGTPGTVATKKVSPRNDSSPVKDQDSGQSLTPALSNNLPKEGPVLAQTEIKTRKKMPEPATYMTQMAMSSTSETGSRSASDFSQVSLKGDIPGNCSQISEADPYLTFVNPDGYLIRISKKLAETLGCVYTSSNSDNYNRCQDQIKKWRDKIAQSPATSSPDNFMDILNVIKSVQE